MHKLTLKEVCLVFFLSAISLCLFFILGWHFGYNRLIKPPNVSKTLGPSDLTYAYDLVKKQFYRKVDEPQIIADSIGTLISSLSDPYSYYVNSKDYELLRQISSGDLVGTGIRYSLINGDLKIIEVLPDSPAESMGLKPKDKIIMIDGISISEFKKSIEIEKKLLGKEGEQVTIIVEDAKNSQKEFILTKKKMHINSFNFKLVKDNVGYLKIYQFGPSIKEEFSATSKLIKKENLGNLIIDLRNNTGGDVEMALYLADQFIDKGVLVKETFKNLSKNNIRMALGQAPFKNMKIIVLINGETSSAAEIFAAALKDNGRAKLAGEKTFGKGTEGNFFELSDGSAVHLTIGTWYTPQGISIEGKGIEPDFFVSDNSSKEGDELLNRAIDLLLSN